MRRMIRLFVLLLLCAAVALPSLADAPSPELAEALEARYPQWEVEDCIFFPRLTNKDYAFALLRRDNRHMLVGYRGTPGDMQRYLSNENALPHGEGQAQFIRHGDGHAEPLLNYPDDLGFTILFTRTDAPDAADRTIDYHWNGSRFTLTAWMNQDYYAKASATGITYYAVSRQMQRLGRASGVLQKDMRYVSWSALPKTLAEAREVLSNPPSLPAGDLPADEVSFTGGRQYPVYSGPGESYLRGADGRAVLSTNDWVQVFGLEGGWAMVQYDITADRMRIGYIQASALPEDAEVSTLRLAGEIALLIQEAGVTDDPLGMAEDLARVPAGYVTYLANLGGWAYIEARTADGTLLRGFVPEYLVQR